MDPTTQSYIEITGGKALHGEVTTSGSKNTSLPLLACACLLEGRLPLMNVPDIRDVTTMLQLIREIGYTTTLRDGMVEISRIEQSRVIDMNAASAIRASYYLIPAMVRRYGTATLPWPGGCSIGHRAMDLHFTVYEAFGDHVSQTEIGYTVSASQHRPDHAVEVELPFPSRGATIAAILRSVGTDRCLQLQGANHSPEVRALLGALQKLNYSVTHANSTLTVYPPEHANGGPQPYSIPGDKIEAATLLMALAITRGSGVVNGVNPKHIAPVISLLKQLQFEIEVNDRSIHIMSPSSGPKRVDINVAATLDPNGWDADWEPLAMALALTVPGTHSFEDAMNPGRHSNLIPQLARLGAQITPRTATHCTFSGAQELKASSVTAADIRTGAALMLASLSVDGHSRINRSEQIARGYSDLPGKLTTLGARVETQGGT